MSLEELWKNDIQLSTPIDFPSGSCPGDDEEL